MLKPAEVGAVLIAANVDESSAEIHSTVTLRSPFPRHSPLAPSVVSGFCPKTQGSGVKDVKASCPYQSKDIGRELGSPPHHLRTCLKKTRFNNSGISIPVLSRSLPSFTVTSGSREGR